MALNLPFDLFPKIQRPYSPTDVLQVVEHGNDVGFNTRLRIASKPKRSFPLKLYITNEEFKTLNDFVIRTLYSATIPVYFLPPYEEDVVIVQFSLKSGKWYSKKTVYNKTCFVEIELEEVAEI